MIHCRTSTFVRQIKGKYPARPAQTEICRHSQPLSGPVIAAAVVIKGFLDGYFPMPGENGKVQ